MGNVRVKIGVNKKKRAANTHTGTRVGNWNMSEALMPMTSDTQTMSVEYKIGVRKGHAK